MLHNFRTASRPADERKNALAALNKDFIDIMTASGVSGLKADPTFLMRAGQLIRESIADEFSMTDPTPIFTNRRTGNLGDKIEFVKKFKTLRVVKYSPQSQPLMFSPVKGKYTISTKMYELPYGIELFKILTRQYEIADFVSDAAAALVRHNVDLVLTALSVACATGVNDLRGRALRSVLGTSDVDKTSLDAAIRRLGPNQTIYAQRWALDPIFTFGATQSLQTQEELHQRGLIGTYRGCNLVAVEDDYNEYTAAFTTAGKADGTRKDWEKLIFIGGSEKPAQLMERDISALNWEETDSEKALFRSSIRMDHGVFVDKPYRAHVVELA